MVIIMEENNLNQQPNQQYSPDRQQTAPQYAQQQQQAAPQYAQQQQQAAPQYAQQQQQAAPQYAQQQQQAAPQYAQQQQQAAPQYAQQQQPRQVPFTQVFNPPYDPTTQVMSVGEYIGLFILSSIPVVNIICWIVWLCSDSTNKNKKNYIKANIVIWVLSVVLLVLFYVFIFSVYGASFLDF